MNNKHRWAVAAVAAVTMAASAFGFAACGNGENNDNKENEGNGGTNVAGTYTIRFTNSELSGNIRHTGYLTSSGDAQETNTLVLKADNTYEYTKYITSRTTQASLSTAQTASYALTSAAARSEAEDERVLFSWTSAGDGACTLDFYKDGTYKFYFTSYGLTETGTWTWNNWTMTIKQSNDSEITATMDGTTNALNLHYVAVANSALTHDFTCSSSIWGVALGTQGSYTPEEGGGSDQSVTVQAYYAGSGQKSTEYNGQTVTYDVTAEMVMLSSGDVYYVEATETNSTVYVGEWSKEGQSVTITVNGKNATMTSQTTISYDGLTLTYGTLPDKYADTDWAELIEDAKTPAASGPVQITYTFTGSYTNDGTNVTLNPATACEWSENWGIFEAHGFTSVSGGTNDKVYPKGETGEWYLPLDHFAGKYYFAPNSATTVTNNTAVKVTVNSDGSFNYVEESIFD